MLRNSSVCAMSMHYIFIFGHHTIHQIPKRFLVIFFTQVGQFVNNDSVDKRRINTHRRHRHSGIIFSESYILVHLCLCVCLLQILPQPITKTKSILRATASPSSFRFSDFDTRIFWEICSFPEFLYSRYNVFSKFLLHFLHFCF